MKVSNPNSSGHSFLFALRRQNGFALVISLSLMVLLTVLAVGLLGLSSLSLATSVRETDRAEARANARMALALAISQLQKQTGPDQRITTTADQLSSGADGSDTAAGDGRRHWTGTYRSWLSTANTRPSPQFLSWLVSGETTDLEDVAAAKSAGTGDETIELVGEGTVGDSSDGRVNAPVLTVESLSGGAARLAWWTGDQGTKAAIATPPPATDMSFAALRAGVQAAPRNALELVKAGNETPFEDLEADDSRLALITDWKQSGFLAADTKSPQPLFHDVSPFSTGLLTNVRAGGFRKDLSMHLERTISTAAASALYTVGGEPGINLHELKNYYNLYKDLKRSGGGNFTTGGKIASSAPFLQVAGSPTACRSDQYFFYKQPTIISYQMVLSFETRVITVVENGVSRTFNALCVVGDPVITFWNPLDVPVVVPTASFFSIKYWQIPYDLIISVSGGGSHRCALLRSFSGGDGNYLTLQAGAAQQLVFKPGEVIKVSQSGAMIQRSTNSTDHRLVGRAGFNYGGGVSLPVRNDLGGYIEVPANAKILYEARPNGYTAGASGQSGSVPPGFTSHTRHFSLTHHETYVGYDRIENGDTLGYGGMFLDWDFGNKRLKANEDRGATSPGVGGTKAPGARLYANKFPNFFRSITHADGRELTAAQLAGTKAPFMIVSYNAKTEADSDRKTKFLSRFNPKAHHVDFYDLSDKERDMLPYEFVVEPLVSWKNRSLETSTNGNAYYGGGLNAQLGNSFLTTHSAPREPIVSLAAFQHAFANGFEMQVPKFGYGTLNAREPMLPQISHAIGNSLAPAILAPGQTEGSLNGGRPVADHSYLANRGLWDEWFLSGIAPQTVAGFGPKRAQKVVCEEFLKGSGKLPVVRYLPDTDDTNVAKVVATLFSGALPTDAATQTAASLIRVDGMFNVNSTSIEAWKAMLGALKGRQIVVRDSSGGESIATAEGKVPVVSLHGPQNLVTDGSGSVNVKDPDQWVGRRELSEGEIDSLARAIVKEVRKRGPFLSLADFINRRPGSDKDLARAGTIQSALDADEVKINSAYQSGGREIGTAVANRFAFPDAEEGPSGYGMPGIVKQADILTPIGPVLSARSDSFIIRAYGESVDKDGKILARAWCEATVERDKNFIDTEDKPETLLTALKSDANKTFGRRYEMTSFRWLHPDEV